MALGFPIILAAVALLLNDLPITEAQTENYVRVCAFSNAAQYRPGAGTFTPEDIDSTLCSHMTYQFAGVNDLCEIMTYDWNDEDLYARFNAHKGNNPTLKTLLTVGTELTSTAKITWILGSKENRTHFVDHSIGFLRDRNFDGIDLDFRYPGSLGSPPDDKQSFSLLLEEMRAAYDAEAQATGEDPLLITATVGVDKDIVDRGYEVDKITSIVDWVVLLTHQVNINPGSLQTSHPSPLFPSSGEVGANVFLNVEWSVQYWESLGAPKDKIVIGVSTTGKGYTLVNSEDNGYGSPASGPSPGGEFLRQPGVLSYYEVCHQRFSNYGWHAEHMVPYSWKDSVWVAGDDNTSLAIKVHWLRCNDNLGWAAYSMDTDDFSSQFCGGSAYPLHVALNEALEGPPQCDFTGTTDITTASTSTTTPPDITGAPTTPTEPPELCSDPSDTGLYPVDGDCTMYIRCSNGDLIYEDCSEADTYFHPDMQGCTWCHMLDPDRQEVCRCLVRRRPRF